MRRVWGPSLPLNELWRRCEPPWEACDWRKWIWTWATIDETCLESWQESSIFASPKYIGSSCSLSLKPIVGRAAVASLELGWSVPQSIAGKCLSKGVEKDSNELDYLKYKLVYTLYIRYFCSVSLHSWESTLIVWYVNGYFLCKSLKILD